MALNCIKIILNRVFICTQMANIYYGKRKCMLLKIKKSSSYHTPNPSSPIIPSIKKPTTIKWSALYSIQSKNYSSIFTFPLFLAITSSAILFGAGL